MSYLSSFLTGLCWGSGLTLGIVIVLAITFFILSRGGSEEDWKGPYKVDSKKVTE